MAFLLQEETITKQQSTIFPLSPIFNERYLFLENRFPAHPTIEVGRRVRNLFDTFLYKQQEQNPTGRAIANDRPPPFSPSPTPDGKHLSFRPPKSVPKLQKLHPNPTFPPIKSFQIN
jgi:hypothetical protein